ncbi:hypothetical protein CPB84DRAFT_1672024 [Gymnopilus junonius]|uniref:CxC2-like cysteine cluster KDZ transposase-associated domain-containing protein n=1 Tax=Gymnopilus junonius TaxID=109634 RepID=A0A9P5P080_GYMJU|nr:hypothetical protein CPB84DRAFT_1672024 [Gymnopilus junonius]
MSWALVDNREFALDPDWVWYDEALSSDILPENPMPNPSAQLKPKKKKSHLARHPHVIWKEVHRSTYLDEICRFAGRGNFRSLTDCPDCKARAESEPSAAEYHCEECFMPDLTCKLCCIHRHKMQPLHRIQLWNGTHFTMVSLKSLGLKVQLGHTSLFCENPLPCHTSLCILHVNGIHEVAFNYCGCSRAIPQHLQLLRHCFFPASQLIVKTCASFELLDVLHKFALTTKASTYDFYRALEKLTDNTGLSRPKSRYHSLFRIIMQWCHLKLLKWGGRAHDPEGVDATKPGELALNCPSCPYPGINLPDGWEHAPTGVW